MANHVVKRFTSFEVKDADQGLVEAIIATLGTVDRDEDIIRKDAVPNGAKVTMSAWGHDAVYGNRPVGKGTLSVDGNKLKFSGRVFLTTADGRETFAVLKEMGTEQEWSFGFAVLGAEVPSEAERKQGARRVLTKLDAFEVSPVLMGAGVGTRTLGVKEAGATPQADGATDEDRALVEEVVTAIKAKRDAEAAALAETKAAADAIAATEAARVAAETDAARLAQDAETKAAADAEAARVAADLKAKAAEEFARFRRTMQRRSA